MENYNYKITISYDGKNYSGWQIQSSKNSIQEMIQKALNKTLQEDIKIIGAGRTDAQVHALGQVANFKTIKQIDTSKMCYSLNCILPKDIRILKIEEVDLSFHARFSASSKVYRYHISLSDIQDPFSRFYSYKPQKKLDILLLEIATKYFLGTHDFSAFANKQNKGSAKNKPIKTMKRLDLIKNKDEIILEFEASGFLYKMVRNIVGTLLDVATKKIPLEMIEKIFATKDRKKASKPAPAHGLFLVRVNYNNLSGISSKDLK